MKKIFCFLAVTFISTFCLSAQDYNWAVGVRGGGEMVGLTGKYKFSAASAVEAILAFPYDGGFVVTGLYERHIPIIQQGFNLYYGGGAHIGAWDSEFSIGIDAIVGLEYKIPRIPLAFSVDYKPIFNIGADTKFYMADIALGIKYTF